MYSMGAKCECLLPRVCVGGCVCVHACVLLWLHMRTCVAVCVHVELLASLPAIDGFVVRIRTTFVLIPG